MDHPIGSAALLRRLRRLEQAVRDHGEPRPGTAQQFRDLSLMRAIDEAAYATDLAAVPSPESGTGLLPEQTLRIFTEIARLHEQIEELCRRGPMFQSFSPLNKKKAA